MYEVLYLHQTFTDCISYQYTHFDVLLDKTTITESSLVLLGSWKISMFDMLFFIKLS